MTDEEKIFNVLSNIGNQLTGYFYNKSTGDPSHKGIAGVMDKLDEIVAKLGEISQKLDRLP